MTKSSPQLATTTSADPIRALLWMLGTLASFVLMAIAGRELAGELSTFQVLLVRSLIGLLAVTVILSRRGRWRQLISRQPATQLLRNIAHFGGQYGWFYGIAFIPLAEVFALEFTTPIWTALFAAWLLSERIKRGRIIAIVLGLAGTLIILRPGLAAIHPAAIAVLLGAVCYGLSHTLTKKLTVTDSPLSILFYMTLIQLPLALLPAVAQWQTPTLAHWPWLLAVGFTALSAHYCMARALTLADASLVLPMDYLRLPLVAVLGYLLYGEVIDSYLILGAALMLAGNGYSVWVERRTADF